MLFFVRNHQNLLNKVIFLYILKSNFFSYLIFNLGILSAYFQVKIGLYDHHKSQSILQYLNFLDEMLEIHALF